MKRGTITPALLVIASAFIIIIYGLLFILSLQFDFSQRQIANERALNIAEAGINYYRWHLSVDPDDYTDGTNNPDLMPYEHDYSDPQGDVIGKYSLEIEAPTESYQVVTIRSTGWLNQYPRVKRTITVKYGRVTLTKYAFLHNSNMWFGNDITVTGPVFSNGGIRLDGHNTSTVESAKETYICGIESGCTGAGGEEKPGIWGNGEIDELWSFPVAPIDFESIKVDFGDMQASAITSGLNLGQSGAQGYHLKFSDDGNVSVYRVTGTSPILAYSLENGCESLYEIITSEVATGTYSLASVPIIFAEDNVWVEGIVNGKTTVAAARFPLGTFNANIWLKDDLTYLARDGNHKLGLVAENDIIITRGVPEYFDLDGALLAQNGRIIRHHYGWFGCRSPGSDRLKNEFNFYGSLISNQRAYWNFSSGARSPATGFVKSTLDYDSTNFGSPPPYFPTFGGYRFLSWKEERSD
ncbi:hypothetical protein A2865_02285 [Candidatus Woesebacteria bacterium RIFCSPHIGHO2_01_FULL_39_17]|uniref:DUF4900 domain-containing protein n=3 Tax=Candidatus Woeseibacteriota TaxID=1752722 RepID=A0A0G0NCT0_9BACT|nr:MAG: hypothetical protein US72_C0009G0022 [Microgenomates group bacterium GW2011_GWC1_38_12]KKQ93910.1 MAG: hypothetical protein UT19_C0006G0038 [Candidatus Woesebacteria bacterium GW2011_GWB1_39_10b]KKR13979.1 MAG: hypothetical protein UT40_C0007G0021 [Candidatus Woesebacteria bacterium GW2011_GWA1_39_21b]OGM23471.1 MAG: hypothetical protein A2865_02285 [Candidatus Woesebacteria bacterium RIFCSPHIGHO2_01_FULL_39_17]OGM64260.1 MAG: hypothetical protein A3A52_03110 [Candidatus Woesebacteria b